MNEIRNVPTGGGYIGGANGSPAPTEAANTGATSSLDSVKLLQEMSKMAASLQAQSPNGVSGVSNSNGAPAIDGVNLDFSPEDMAAALLVLQSKTQEAQLGTAREGLVTSKKKLEEKNQQAMDKINDWIKKCEEAAAKAKSAGIFGWITKIAGFLAAALAVVVAAVATAATGGAAAPLLALAVIGMVGATISLASQISQEAGGPPLELSSLMSKLCTKVLEACGVPKEDAEKWGGVMSGMAGMLSGAILVDPAFAGQFAGGIAQIAGADATQAAIVAGVFTAVASIAITVVMIAATGGAGAGAAIDGMAKTVMTAAKIGQAVAGVTAGASAVAGGGLNISKAIDERDASKIQSDKKMIDAMIAKLQKQMEDDREEIKKVMQEMMDGMNIVSQMINSAGQSRSQITANLSGKGQTI
jgi:transloator